MKRVILKKGKTIQNVTDKAFNDPANKDQFLGYKELNGKELSEYLGHELVEYKKPEKKKAEVKPIEVKTVDNKQDKPK